MFRFGLIVLPDMVPDQRGIGQPESHSPSLAVLRSRAEAETRWEWGFSLGDSLLRFPLTWDSLTSGPGDPLGPGLPRASRSGLLFPHSLAAKAKVLE